MYLIKGGHRVQIHCHLQERVFLRTIFEDVLKNLFYVKPFVMATKFRSNNFPPFKKRIITKDTIILRGQSTQITDL